MILTVSQYPEVGRPFALTDNGISNGDWEIEPQAQLIYQYRTFSNFKTEHDVSVNQKDRHGLRGRAGVRLAYNTGTPELKTNTIYFVSNVVHDFIDNDQTVKIGSDSIKEKLPLPLVKWAEGFSYRLVKPPTYIWMPATAIP